MAGQRHAPDAVKRGRAIWALDMAVHVCRHGGFAFPPEIERHVRATMVLYCPYCQRMYPLARPDIGPPPIEPDEPET